MINKNKIKMVIFDVDNTLIYGDLSLNYYKQYSKVLEKTLAKKLDLSLEEAKTIADAFRKQFNGHGESSFNALGIGIDVWYEEILKINTGYIQSMVYSKKLLLSLKKDGIKVAAITDGPTQKSYDLLKKAKIDKEVFDLFIGWEKGSEMPKNGKVDIYKKVISQYKLRPEEVVMVGDSLHTDIYPAKKLGLETIYVCGNREKPRNIKSIKTIEELI